MKVKVKIAAIISICFILGAGMLTLVYFSYDTFGVSLNPTMRLVNIYTSIGLIVGIFTTIAVIDRRYPNFWNE